ncbi:Mor transcription activator family protein, partial [Kingella kingae]
KGKHNTARLALLHEAIGKRKTEQLLDVFGGDELYVPRCQVVLRRLRNQQFRADFAALTDDGKTSKAMAYLQLLPKYQISNRTADAILQEREVLKVAQGDLF